MPFDETVDSNFRFLGLNNGFQQFAGDSQLSFLLAAKRGTEITIRGSFFFAGFYLFGIRKFSCFEKCGKLQKIIDRKQLVQGKTSYLQGMEAAAIAAD